MGESSADSAGIAGRYASAVFELAEESGALERVEADLAALKAAIAESAEFRAFLSNPILGREEQGAAMAALLQKMEIGAPVSSLVGLMAAKRRLFVLPDVIEAFAARLAKKRGVVSAEVVSAQPLSDAQRDALTAKIKDFAGADVALEEKVDAGLIGGLVVRVGSKMIDASIRSKLSQLETVMKGIGR